ncbi:MAG: hypothetical protein AB1592_08825 [Pseudomonadota bacterium]
MTWTPPDRDIHPYETILSLAIRDTILAAPSGNGEGTWREVEAQGEALNLHLRVAPRERRTFNGRAVLAYAVAGDAVAAGTGYRCEGEALIDLKTRAFLAVECRLLPVGDIARPAEQYL